MFDYIHKHITKRLPYDWRNPPGYLVTVFIQSLVCIPLFQYVGCFALLAFGVCMFAIAFVKNMKNDLQSINNMASGKLSREKMCEKLVGFMRIHAHIKELSR